MAGFLSLIARLFSPRPKAADYEVADTYSGLRNMVLSMNPDQIGVKLRQPSEVWGVLMETGYATAAVSLVALADGTVSLYFSNGGGIIGLGPHPGPHRAAQAWLAAAQAYVQQAQPTRDSPLPRPSWTRFYLLTGDGIRTVDAPENDLGYNRHPFSPLFHKGHELIAEIRAVDEKLRHK